MKIFACRICGEVYLGKDIPGTCPFCGVANKYLRMGSAWVDENKGVELSEISKVNLEKALEIELSNAALYSCLSKTISNQEVALMFKGLFKVEREHASVFKKLLGLTETREVVEECEDDVLKALEESSRREKIAVDFYAKALSEASEERVRLVFEAIMNAEKDHLELDGEMQEKLK